MALADREFRPMRRFLVAMGVSLLTHALLLAWWQTHGGETMPKPATTLTVVLAKPEMAKIPELPRELPAEPPPKPPAVKPPPEKTPPRRQPTQAKAEKPTKPPQSVIALEPASKDAAATETVPVVANTPPTVDLDAAKSLARQIGKRTSGPSAQQRLESRLNNPVRIDPLAKAVGSAARPDCKTAHSGAGLLALPMLAWDSVTDSGCRW